MKLFQTANPIGAKIRVRNTPFEVIGVLETKGANIVGLRRRGFKAETIQKINEAIKLWVRPDVQKEQTLLEIESQTYFCRVALIGSV